MDLAALVEAVDVLRSPLTWDSREAWLEECLRRARGACRPVRAGVQGHPARELEALLTLAGDPPGWLDAALESPDAEPGPADLPTSAETSESIFRVLILRCALAAGLATLHRTSPALPTTQELRVQFGLRGREPQVALLAAEGLSNAAIAERLRLSAHTVRHYLERVLDRLGLHTRKGLALHLMAGCWERPLPRRPRPE